MSTNIGQPLRRAREARSLSIEQAATVTHIRPHYLRAIEADEFETFPSSVHARGFLRAYADFLGIDPEPLVVELEQKEETEVEDKGSELAPIQDQPAPDLPSHSKSDAIFHEIGQKLRHQRELLGISIDDVERHTHLRLHYLKALEAGDMEGLPSPVQGRGMLNNYASFLGLNPETMLLRFADGLQAQLECPPFCPTGEKRLPRIAASLIHPAESGDCSRRIS